MPPPPPILDLDVPCLSCSYNLRGLPLAPDARCPECGSFIAPSLHGTMPLQTLHTLRLAARYAALAAALMLPVYLLYAIIAVFIRLPFAILPVLALLLIQTVTWSTAVLHATACVIPMFPVRRLNFPITARVASVCAVVAALAMACGESVALVSRAAAPVAHLITTIALALFVFALAVSIYTTGQILEHFGRSLGDARLASQLDGIASSLSALLTLLGLATLLIIILPHRQWNTLYLVSGLLGCSAPLVLLLTLSALPAFHRLTRVLRIHQSFAAPPANPA